MTIVQIIAYAAIAIFALVVLIKAARYKMTPIHVRWELYPVAHEKGRASYGGSVFEEFEWWDKPREKDTFNELKEMFEEIVLLKGVFHNNRTLWWSSFPFHLGLYTVIAWLALLVTGAIALFCGADVAAGGSAFGAILHTVTAYVGYAGLFLTTIGAAGLILTRLTVQDLKKFNSPMEYFNLLFVGGVTLFALIVSASTDPGFAAQREFTATLISFGSADSLVTPAIIKVEIVLAMLLLAYMPLTRMSHFVAKYFLYHEVRWEDTPNRRGSRIEARVKNALNFGVSWEGKHIQKGKTWGEVVTENKE
jgi:nitrate reductase gamma subunit